MKSLILLLAVVGVLLFAGCASGPQVSTAPPTVPPVTPPVKNVTAPPPTVPPAPPAENVTPPVENQTPAMSPDSCTVEFQKDASSVYYVMVKTDSSKTLTVQCPNGGMAILKGQLWFCEDLGIPNAATAYLDGKECGSARFLAPNNQQSALGCSIKATPSRVSIGQSVDVTVSTSTGDKQVQVSYTCGDSEKTQTRSGLVTDGSLCTFNTPGSIEVDAKMDGAICASTVLQVFAKAKDCSVYGSTYTSNNGVYTYTAQLAARGYSSEDNIIYYCYGSNNQQSVDTIQNSTDFVTTIKCYGSTQLTAPVKVIVGADECGYLELPATQ